MILSDVDIQDCIERGEIQIDPFNPSVVKPASYTFTLGATLFIPQTTGVIDTKSTEISYQEVRISDDGYIIEPGAFLLGQTYERVTMSQSIACMMDNKTSLARIGLNVILGSTFIEPGQKANYQTLEISNLSQNPIKVYKGMKVAKGIFFRLSSKAQIDYQKVGTYAKQDKPHVKLKETSSK